MKLDASDLRYVTPEEFRVLTAVEMGSKNHEVVPTQLIAQIAGLRGGGVNKSLGSLAKRNLVSRVQNIKYDGYRLTYGGYDFLAIRALSKRDSMYSVGNQIGVGKESDIYCVADAEGTQMALKLHRLGRISFRAIKEKRDYMGKRKSASWMYMSRLAAQKEWAFMQVLHQHGFPVPRPVDHARHCILMELIDAYPLRSIADVQSPGRLYSQLMDLIVRFAHAGLIHGDFNEFNILIHRETGEPIVIDFPQMVSTSHVNAEYYFNRDVECIRRFFKRRFRYESVLYPRFRTVLKEGEEKEKEGGDDFRLDVVVEASGFGRKEMRTLEEYMEAVRDETQEEGLEDEEMVTDSDEVDNEEEENSFEKEEDVVHQKDEKVSEGGTSRVTNLADYIRGMQDTADEDDVDGDLDVDDVDDVEGVSDEEKGEGGSSGASSASRRSRAPSPTDSLVAHTAALNITPSDDPPPQKDKEIAKGLIKDRVAEDIRRDRLRQTKKYHSKPGTRRIGRPKGSKAKQDMRVKLDRSSVWD